MGQLRIISVPRPVALTGALVAAGLLLAWSVGFAPKASADFPHPGLNYYIEAVDQDGCDTTEGDAVCYIEPGSDFTVDVILDPLPGNIPSYEGFDVYITYTGLTSADDADANAYWPDCGFPVVHFEPGLVAGGCAIGIESGPSTYTGTMLTNTFTCSDSGTISLVAGDNKTDLLETNKFHHAEGVDVPETLNITCGDEPTATNTPAPETPTAAVPTALPGTGNAGPDVSDSATGIWLAVGALMTLAAVGLSAFVWRNSRSA